jgi:hypothetical protein
MKNTAPRNRHERRVLNRAVRIKNKREMLPVMKPFPVNGTRKQQFFYGCELEFRKMANREGLTLKQFLVLCQPEWKEFRDG